MAKLGRIKQEIFAIDSLSTQTAEFGTTKDTPVYTKDASVIQNSNFKSGWDSALLNNEAPYREDRNGVDLAMTRQLAYIYETGTPEYNEETNYCLGAECKVIGTEGNFKIYSSKVEDNLGNPTTDTSKWTPVFDTESAGVSLTTEVPFYQNAGGNLEQVSEGVFKVPVGSLFTLANGLSFTRDDEPTADLTGRSDGDYYIFVGKTGKCQIWLPSYVKIQKEEPTSPRRDEIWFNPYSAPYTSQRWDGSAWVDFPYAISNTLVTVDSSATTVVAFPPMTGENLPAGQYSSASSTGGSKSPSWKAFDGDTDSSWSTTTIAGSHRLTRWADKAVTANAVYLSAVGAAGDSKGAYSLGSFTLRGSNDGIVWTDIQTYTDLPSQSGGLTLLFPKSTYKYFDIYNAFARGGDGGLWMYEVSYRLIQAYRTTDIGNRTAYTEAKDITPVSGVSFDVLSSINGGGWTAISDGVLYATIGMGNTDENRIYIDGVQITQITSREDDSHGQINSCTSVILHKGQVVSLGSRPLAGAIFLPARKGSFE